MPTLFTKIEQFYNTPLSFRSLKIRGKNYLFWHSEKSAVTYSVRILFSQEALNFTKALSIFVQFLAIMQMLNPSAANSQQNPKPIPSLPPVTTTHVFSPYLSAQFFSGSKLLTSAHNILPRKTAKNNPPTIARKYMKFKVDCSMYQLQIVYSQQLDKKTFPIIQICLKLGYGHQQGLKFYFKSPHISFFVFTLPASFQVLQDRLFQHINWLTLDFYWRPLLQAIK